MQDLHMFNVCAYMHINVSLRAFVFSSIGWMYWIPQSHPKFQNLREQQEDGVNMCLVPSGSISMHRPGPGIYFPWFVL